MTRNSDQEAKPDAAVRRFVADCGLVPAEADPRFTRLTGGVSSDIWRVDAGRTTFCVKRALPKLRVAADWYAPIERNATEAEWFRVVARVLPTAVPAVLAEHKAAGIFAMPFLAPARHPNWKQVLSRGEVDRAVAEEVGRRLAAIHRATAADPSLAGRFATDEIFHAIRLEPYLLATARAHPGLADRLGTIARITAQTKRALVHGDVSPKNILVGPDGPIFLDAECAWWGDPAFDLAFCLNHLLLKCLWVPPSTYRYLDAFRALAGRYLEGVDWEPAAGLEQRVAALLPGLFLGRVDGKSPAEYVTAAADKDAVRTVARLFLETPVDRLEAIADTWCRHLAGMRRGR